MITMMNDKSTDTLHPDILVAIWRALLEDVGSGDITTNSIVPMDASMHGRIIAKQNGIIAGLDVAKAVYEIVDPKIDFNADISEGARVDNRQTVATRFRICSFSLDRRTDCVKFFGSHLRHCHVNASVCGCGC